jgi:hypothetical protein
MTDATGVRFGLATSALVLSLLVAGALPLDHLETAVVALVVTGAASAVLPRPLAVVMGVVSWAFFTGFFENQYGVLTFARTDLLNLAVFVAATVVLASVVRGTLDRPIGSRDE